MIQAENLVVRYEGGDGKAVLNNLNFSLKAGEKAALIGANGMGKSTFLLTLTGVLLPSGGRLFVDGVQARKENLKELRRRAGLVFQNPDDQFFMPTVEDDIAFGPRNFGMDEAELKLRMDDILNKLGIGDLRSRPAYRLSGGEKRLAALAGILIMEPSLLLLDEPATFLDPRARRNLLAVLGDLPRTMLIATHDFDLARQICSRAAVLKDGVLIAEGGPALLDDAALLEEAGL